LLKFKICGSANFFQLKPIAGRWIWCFTSKFCFRCSTYTRICFMDNPCEQNFI